MKIMVLTPGRGMISVYQRDMLMRLAMRLKARGDSIATADEVTPGFLHHSRSVLLGTLAMRYDVSWGLWLDTDCSFDPDAVLEMSLRHDAMMIAWNYPVRVPYDMQFPPEHLLAQVEAVRKSERRWVGTALMSQSAGETWTKDGRLIELDQCAFGAVLMRREVAMGMTQVTPATYDWNGHVTVPSFDLIASRVGEDYSFCRRFRAASGRIWCDPRPYVTNGQSGGRFADEIARCRAFARETPIQFSVAA
jgi:hypothetical protein